METAAPSGRDKGLCAAHRHGHLVQPFQAMRTDQVLKLATETMILMYMTQSPPHLDGGQHKDMHDTAHHNMSTYAYLSLNTYITSST